MRNTYSLRCRFCCWCPGSGSRCRSGSCTALPPAAGTGSRPTGGAVHRAWLSPLVNRGAERSGVEVQAVINTRRGRTPPESLYDLHGSVKATHLWSHQLRRRFVNEADYCICHLKKTQNKTNKSNTFSRQIALNIYRVQTVDSTDFSRLTLTSGQQLCPNITSVSSQSLTNIRCGSCVKLFKLHSTSTSQTHWHISMTIITITRALAMWERNKEQGANTHR